MPTEKPRITITIPDEELQKIEEFRFGKKIRNQTQAILTLIRLGMEEIQKEEDKKSAPISDRTDIEAPSLNDVISGLTDILSKAGVIGSDGNISDSDFEFLAAMFLAMDAHFNGGKIGRK